MATWSWPIVAGDAMEIAPRVRVAKFGDGYEQRVEDGIHTMLRRQPVRLAADHDTVDAAEAFLRARGGVESFDWPDAGGAAGKWVCRKWSRAWVSAQHSELAAEFEEVVA